MSLSLILRGLPKSVKPKSIKDWFRPIKIKGLKVIRGDVEAVACTTFFQSSDVKKALQRNGQFFGGVKVLSDFHIVLSCTKSCFGMREQI